MEERQELWLMTTVSILAACGGAHLIRWLLNILIGYMNASVDSNKDSVESYITRARILRASSEAINAAISTFMLVAGTYEKCLLIGKGLFFEYYSTTLVLIVIYSYTLHEASPNPLSLVIKHWDKLVLREVKYVENSNHNNNVLDSLANKPPQGVDGVRRRGGEEPAVVPILTSDSGMTSQRRKPHDSIQQFFRLSGPSLLGQFIGLHIALEWLHVAWDGYLTDHHFDNTGLLRKCIICLQTGPIQGFIIEAAITYFLAVFYKWLSNPDGPFKMIARSFFFTSCVQSIVLTAVLYMFIDVTGAFANPLLAYALERKCLYDVTSIINHIIVYVFGALAGTIMYKAVPPSKHFASILFIIFSFSLSYLFVPQILDKDLFFPF